MVGSDQTPSTDNLPPKDDEASFNERKRQGHGKSELYTIPESPSTDDVERKEDESHLNEQQNQPEHENSELRSSPQPPSTNNLPPKEDASPPKEQNQQIQLEDFEFCSVPKSNCAIFQMLIQEETTIQPVQNGKSSWFKQKRLEGIKWILDCGLRFPTTGLALMYFDGHFSRITIDDGNEFDFHLTLVACLSLAVKKKEKAPLNYSIEGYDFNGDMIRKKELSVLGTSGRCLSPFHYLTYFITQFFGICGHGETLDCKAGVLVWAVMVDIIAAEERPSVVAAAAFLAAYDHQMSKMELEMKMNMVPSWGSLEKERLFSFYKRMQGIILQTTSKATKSTVSPNPLSKFAICTTTQGRMDVLRFGHQLWTTYYN